MKWHCQNEFRLNQDESGRRIIKTRDLKYELSQLQMFGYQKMLVDLESEWSFIDMSSSSVRVFFPLIFFVLNVWIQSQIL